MKAKIKRDLDLEDEGEFLSDDDLLSFANEAIDDAEAEVHTLYEDYFLSKGSISLVSGTDEYELPSDIYAHKIRRIVYQNGSKIYKVSRINDWKKFELYSIERVNNTNTLYYYFLINAVAGAPRILMTPVPQETTADAMIVWYLRQAAELTQDADIMDIPEAHNFIYQYIKVRCYEKEQHPMLQKAMVDLDRERALLQGTLAAMTPDAENEVPPDISHYEEMS
jgi:hypothetical protein